MLERENEPIAGIINGFILTAVSSAAFFTIVGGTAFAIMSVQVWI